MGPSTETDCAGSTDHLDRVYPPKSVSVLGPTTTLSPSFLSAQAIFEPNLFPYKYINISQTFFKFRHPRCVGYIKNGVSGKVNTQLKKRNIYYIDNMFRPLCWAIIRSTVFQRRLYSVVFTYVISTNEISLLT